MGKFHEFITDGSNFTPIVSDNFSVTLEEDPHHSTFNQQPPIYYPTELSHHSPQPPQKPCDSRLPTEKAEETTVKSQKLIVHENDSSAMADFVEATEKPTELVTTAHTDPTNQVPHPSVCSKNVVPGLEDHGVDTVFADLRTKILPRLVVAVKLSVSNFCIDFTFLAPDLVHHSSFEFKPLISSSTVASTKKRAEHAVAVVAPPPHRSTFIFDPDGTPTVAVLPKCRNHCELQKTVARTVTMAAPPPPCSTFVFDPGGYGHHSLPSSQSQVSAISFRQVSFYAGSIIILQVHLQKL